MLTTLRNANALLTGASAGLGPHIARALAGQGVHLALAARSADKLDGLAAELSASGMKAIAIPTDLTQAAERIHLFESAQAALGPIDILINNAGIENSQRFISKTPAELEQVITTNYTASVMLTHLALPGMLARKRGHVINMSSTAGKLGYPYAAVYGGTKAALFAWSVALREELSGSGVSVSVLTPGWVLHDGVFARHNIQPFWLFGSTTPEKVAKGVLRLLREDLPELVVNSRPFWTNQLLFALFPKFTERMMQKLGVIDFTRRVHEGEQNL
jgi:short-subunit dehydrogenase